MKITRDKLVKELGDYLHILCGVFALVGFVLLLLGLVCVNPRYGDLFSVTILRPVAYWWMTGIMLVVGTLGYNLSITKEEKETQQDDQTISPV